MIGTEVMSNEYQLNDFHDIRLFIFIKDDTDIVKFAEYSMILEKYFLDTDYEFYFSFVFHFLFFL